MGRITILRDFIGIIKDKASQSKAALLSDPKTLSLHLALLRATTHDPFTPPDPRHLATLASGDTSRATVSTAIEILMDRLQTTRDASVAIKCLITVHHIIKRGSFILQDQLSVYPSNGGRNYLKLSNFRDNTTLLTWELSYWVRWYALYLENLLQTSRVLGFFLSSASSSVDKNEEEEEKVSSLINSHLLKEINSLGNLIEQISRMPNSLHTNGNILVDEILGMVGEDYLASTNKVSIRVSEFKERISCLSVFESVELGFALKRREDCKERLSALGPMRNVLVETVWGSISEMKDQVGNDELYGEEGRLMTMESSKNKVSESSRYGERVLKIGDSVDFFSGRFPKLQY